MKGARWAALPGAEAARHGCGAGISAKSLENRKTLSRLRISVHLLAAGVLVPSLATQALAAEGAFSAYGLGTSAFSAGVAPPPGTYVSGAFSYYTGDISGNLTFGGLNIDVAMKIKEFVSGSANLLYVPKETFLGGRPAVSMTVPFGFV